MAYVEVRFVEPSFELLECPNDAVHVIASAARTCYRTTSDDADADERLVRSLIRKGHDSPLEFVSITARVRCDRGVSHEMVRHRLFSFAQESQRYVDSDQRGFEFVLPPGLDDDGKLLVRHACESAAESYAALVRDGVPPEVARYVLPNATLTTLRMRANVREWRHFLRLRCDRRAHPMMRSLARSMLVTLAGKVPVLFDDIIEEVADGG